MKKAILLGGVCAALLVLGTGVTKSFLISQASSADNKISSGTLNVVLSDTNETELVNITKSWQALNVTPGDVLGESSIAIRNKGTLNAQHLDLKFAYVGDKELAQSVVFNSTSGLILGKDKATGDNLVAYFMGNPGTGYRLTTTTGGILPTIDGNDGSTPNGKISLSELSTLGTVRVTALNQAAPIAANTQATLWLNALIDESLTKGGQLIDTTITFTLEQ